MSSGLPSALEGAQLVPIPPGEKAARCKGWPQIRLSPSETQQHLASGGNVAIRLGRASGDLVDADLDGIEALALADIYLPATEAIFGRVSKPRSHRLYRAPGAVYAAFADPLDGSMLLELRADGREGGAHLTLLPPSVTDGECREWHGEIIRPAVVEAAALTRRMGWLAIGCLTMRYVSEHASRRPGPDLPRLLWEADPALGRGAYHWIERLAPDERPPDLKPRRNHTATELRLEEVVAAIPNNCSSAKGKGFRVTLIGSHRGPSYELRPRYHSGTGNRLLLYLRRCDRDGPLAPDRAAPIQCRPNVCSSCRHASLKSRSGSTFPSIQFARISSIVMFGARYESTMT